MKRMLNRAAEENEIEVRTNSLLFLNKFVSSRRLWLNRFREEYPKEGYDIDSFQSWVQQVGEAQAGVEKQLLDTPDQHVKPVKDLRDRLRLLQLDGYQVLDEVMSSDDRSLQSKSPSNPTMVNRVGIHEADVPRNADDAKTVQDNPNADQNRENESEVAFQDPKSGVRREGYSNRINARRSTKIKSEKRLGLRTPDSMQRPAVIKADGNRNGVAADDLQSAADSSAKKDKESSAADGIPALLMLIAMVHRYIVGDYDPYFLFPVFAIGIALYFFLKNRS